jgi:F0F1-type ATP synthase membrane subunit c/vacuolar-type H+-ATPase subunit K
MKTLLKFGVALIMFGALLSALGVGIIRSHAVKPMSATAAASVTASAATTPLTSASATSASTIASSPAKP